uniref:Peroxisomal membrane protein 2 n=1 Tax=Denticeps clupeoides TaxID=299321 RepID=A0AAY4CIA1_9TELE
MRVLARLLAGERVVSGPGGTKICPGQQSGEEPGRAGTASLRWLRVGGRGVEVQLGVESRDVPHHRRSVSLCITGPCSHHFYQMLEVLLPASQPHFMVKRLLLDRLLYAPLLLLLFFLVMNVLEKVRRDYLAALTMNWKVWTPFQFVNINYVPVQVSRFLFSNVVALFWYAYLASGRK